MSSVHKILIVDDDKLNIEIMKEILSSDYRCLEAYSGEEALKAEKAFKPDLILLDIMMPGIDGYEVCRRIRAEETDRFTKIILVSGRSQTQDRLLGYAAGADDYLTKPFNDEELLAKVRVFLKLKSLEEINAMKRNIIDMFSHEVRTPIASIVGPAEMLVESNRLDDDSKELAEIILKGVRRIAELVGKTTMFSRIQSNPDHYESIDPVRCLLDVLVTRQEIFASRNLKVIEHIMPSCVLDGSFEAIKDAVSIIMDRAIQCSANSDSIYVKSGIEDGRSFISIATSRKDGFDSDNSLKMVKYITEIHGGELIIEDSEHGGVSVALKFVCGGTE
jgi:two-component system sensor histidine kinase/response regulator